MNDVNDMQQDEQVIEQDPDVLALAAELAGALLDKDIPAHAFTLADFLVEVMSGLHEIAGKHAATNLAKADATMNEGMQQFYDEVAEAMGLAISQADNANQAFIAFQHLVQHWANYYMAERREAEQKQEAGAGEPPAEAPAPAALH